MSAADLPPVGTARVMRGDARNLPLPDGSVDLVVTSPPYYALRSYTDGGEHYAGQIGDEATPAEYVESLLAVTAECVRVLKPSGSLWVNLGDKYAQSASQWQGSRRGHAGTLAGTSADAAARFGQGAWSDAPAMGRPKSLMGLPWRYALRCIDDLGLILRAEVVWAKPNGLPESVTDRVRRAHETWFHFTVQPRYFSAVDEIREPHSAHPRATYSVGPSGGNREVTRGTFGSPDLRDFAQATLGKLPGSVQTVATEPLHLPDTLGVDHFAAFPTWWPSWIIRGWCPAEVCDVCGEGRRPVTVSERTSNEAKRPVYGAGKHGTGGSTLGPRNVVATITGYACACNARIATPTGSERTDDPSKLTGRAGFNRPRSAGEGVRSITRWEQRHEAEQLRNSPHRDEMATEAGSAFAHYIRDDHSGARPIPESLRLAWRECGWLTVAPEFVPPPTTPGVVLDPFGGTGTTATCAKALGRTGISVDASADYTRVAQWRTNNLDQLARIRGITRSDQARAADNLTSDYLFDLDGEHT